MPVTETRTAQLVPQLTLVRHARITAAETSRIPEWLGQTYEAVQATGQQPSGMPFVRVLAMDAAGMELEVGWPISERVEVSGDLQMSELPGGLVAVATYLGPYDQIAPAYEATVSWCGEHGFAVTGAPWESYITDPHEEPDPERWQTDIHCPIAPASAS